MFFLFYVTPEEIKDVFFNYLRLLFFGVLRIKLIHSPLFDKSNYKKKLSLLN